MTALARFLVRRLLGISVLAWATTAATFALLRVGIPNPGIDAAISQQLGPGQPAVWQYFHYLQNLLHGNLGESLVQPVSVNTILGQAVPPTLSLMVGGMVLWLTAGVLVGTVSALRPGSWTDRIATAGVLAALSVPAFLLALLLLAVFAHLAAAGNLWLQPGYVGISQSPGQWLGRMILPWIAIAAGQAGVTARLARAGILAAVIDQVFALGGIGQAFLTAAKTGDLLVITATTLATVILVAVVNLIADVCYALLNPRVRVA